MIIKENFIDYEYELITIIEVYKMDSGSGCTTGGRDCDGLRRRTLPRGRTRTRGCGPDSFFFNHFE